MALCIKASRAVPGVSLHGFQELVRKYAPGKNTSSTYQLQVRVHMQHLNETA
jgi:hypothetical protein